MITKEELKKEVDKLPEGLLSEVYAILKRMTEKKKTNQKFTLRDFHGQLDNTFARSASYE